MGEICSRILTPEKNKWPQMKLTRAQVGDEYTTPAFSPTRNNNWRISKAEKYSFQNQRNTVYNIREIQLTDSEKYYFHRWARSSRRKLVITTTGNSQVAS